MFARKHRLAKTAEVQGTIKRGRSFFNPYCVVKYKAGSDVPRFTVIVSTKVSKKAVVRNRLKRILRETLRLHLPGFKPGDYVIIAKPAIMKATPADLRSSTVQLFRSVHLLKTND